MPIFQHIYFDLQTKHISRLVKASKSLSNNMSPDRQHIAGVTFISDPIPIEKSPVQSANITDIKEFSLADGSSTECGPKEAGYAKMSPSYSPDGRYIAYLKVKINPNTKTGDEEKIPYDLDRRTKQVKELTNVKPSSGLLCWLNSPRRQVVTGPLGPATVTGTLDQKKLLAAGVHCLHAPRQRRPILYTILPDGSGEVKLAPAPWQTKPLAYPLPVISRDGHRVAFWQADSTGASLNIANLDNPPSKVSTG